MRLHNSFQKKRDYITDSYEHDSTMNMTLGYKKSEIYVYHFREKFMCN